LFNVRKYTTSISTAPMRTPMRVKVPDPREGAVAAVGFAPFGAPSFLPFSAEPFDAFAASTSKAAALGLKKR
jgi:hypothetical protein